MAETTKAEILDDISHKPWIFQHIHTLAITLRFLFIQLGNGAKTPQKKKRKKRTSS